MATKSDLPPPYPGASEPQINKSFSACPNGCETGPLSQGQLKDHLLDCPMQLVECEFASAGCDVKVPRRDLAGHMTESAQHHLLTATLHNLRLTRELHQRMDQKDKQITELQNTIASMNTHLKQLTPLSTNGYVSHDIIMSDFKKFLASGASWTSHTFTDQFQTMKFNLAVGIKKSGKKLYLTVSLVTNHYNKPDQHFSVPLDIFKCSLVVKLLSHTPEDEDFVVSRSFLARIVLPGTFKIWDKFFPVDNLLARNTPYVKDNGLHFQLYIHEHQGYEQLSRHD